MKRSKLFLGATTAILAVAGVAAAKHYGPSVQRYYITKVNGHYCQQIASTCSTLNGSIQCYFTQVNGPVTTRYQLFTQGPVGTLTTANCKQALLYATEH